MHTPTTYPLHPPGGVIVIEKMLLDNNLTDRTVTSQG
jgi:hypothetical protein